ncbi:cytochrome P450 [Streptomyces cucumeris]|uniref:cytochrome P450 n=1 Tax=Streptomyces cucumeris TaxID=2962890 RepID=UPI003D74F30A
MTAHLERSGSAATTSGTAAPRTGCPARPGARPLSGPGFQTDPARMYADMRREHGAVAPVLLEGGVPAWLVLGYRELRQLTSDPALFTRDSSGWNAWDRIPGDWPLLPMIGRGDTAVVYTEGEVHRKRSLTINNALEAVDPYELRDQAEKFADLLVDAFCERGEADLVAEYAVLLPAMVIARIFGFPDTMGLKLLRSLHEVVDGSRKALAGQKALRAGMRELLAVKREVPGPDVASRMIGSSDPSRDEEIIQDLMVLFGAGHQSTADWIGNTLRLMLTDERFALSLSGGRHSVARAMNEVLWEDTPTQNIAGRWATRDTVLGEQRIRAGDLLLLGFAAANADPEVRPDRRVSTEGNSAFLSFGHGSHRCPYPAQEIAEVIARTGVEVLLDRLPDLRLAVSAKALVWRPSPWMRGLSALPVEFTPAPGGVR